MPSSAVGAAISRPKACLLFPTVEKIAPTGGASSAPTAGTDVQESIVGALIKRPRAKPKPTSDRTGPFAGIAERSAETGALSLYFPPGGFGNLDFLRRVVL